MHVRIVQILPDTRGWNVAYNRDGTTETEPVVVWALVEEISNENSGSAPDVRQEVIAMVADPILPTLRFADEDEGFEGLVSPDGHRSSSPTGELSDDEPSSEGALEGDADQEDIIN